MSANFTLNDSQWLALLRQVAASYNEVTLNRGFQYFKQQYVTSLGISGPNTIQGKVTDSDTHAVELRLDRLSASTCTCPVQTNCKHLAALIMELGDRHGYPASQVVNAKTHVDRVDSAFPSVGDLMQLPSAHVSGWHHFLGKYTAGIEAHVEPSQYAERLNQKLDTVGKLSIPFSPLDWIYFEMHTHFFEIRKIKDKIARETGKPHTSPLLSELYKEFNIWLRPKCANIRLSASMDRVRQTLQYIRQQMADETGYTPDDYDLYKTVWQRIVANHPDAAELMSAEIDEMQKVDSLSPTLAAALVFLCLRQSRSEEAWTAIQSGQLLKFAPAALLLDFLKQLLDSGNRNALTDWLSRTADFFARQPFHQLEHYFRYWDEVVPHIPEAESRIWPALESTLPHSLPLAENLMFKLGRWKIWIELQIHQGEDPLQLSSLLLKPIEEKEPERLLPLYHQGVHRYVALKNREGYKSAVKLLARLQQLYGKMEQPERWDRFFAAFVERYGRLRALQEELKKGKLPV